MRWPHHLSETRRRSAAPLAAAHRGQAPRIPRHSLREVVGWWGIVALLWIAALWRIPACPDPWRPDGLLLALLGWAFAQRSLPSWTTAVGRGAVLGGLKDVASSGPFGSWLVVFAGAAWVATWGARTMAREEPVMQVVWVALFALGTLVAQAVWLGLRGDGPTALALLGVFGLPSSIATGVASLLVFPLIKRLLAGT